MDAASGPPASRAAGPGPPVLDQHEDGLGGRRGLSPGAAAEIRRGDGVDFMALAMTRMAFTGELEAVTDTVMANWRYL
jgi:hypothetical protein